MMELLPVLSPLFTAFCFSPYRPVVSDAVCLGSFRFTSNAWPNTSLYLSLSLSHFCFRLAPPFPLHFPSLYIFLFECCSIRDCRSMSSRRHRKAIDHCRRHYPLLLSPSFSPLLPSPNAIFVFVSSETVRDAAGLPIASVHFIPARIGIASLALSFSIFLFLSPCTTAVSVRGVSKT